MQFGGDSICRMVYRSLFVFPPVPPKTLRTPRVRDFSRVGLAGTSRSRAPSPVFWYLLQRPRKSPFGDAESGFCAPFFFLTVSQFPLRLFSNSPLGSTPFPGLSLVALWLPFAVFYLAPPCFFRGGFLFSFSPNSPLP